MPNHTGHRHDSDKSWQRHCRGGDQRFLLVENCGACVKDLWFCKPYLVHGQGAR